MSTQELLIQIKALPLAERLKLMEELARDVREEMQPPRRPIPVEEIRGIAEPVEPMTQRRRTNAAELFGMFKTDNPLPTDEELKEDYINYLVEKYS